MENINLVVAENLRRLRTERKLSLDSVAKLTGVSKSMLGQIERGDVNPTISTVWKIANGLKISFTDLMHRAEATMERIDIKEVRPLREDNGRYRNYPLFPFDSHRRFEMYYIEIDAAGQLDAEPHPPGSQEFITAFSGRLTVSVGEETFSVESGVSLRFQSDVPHRYKNVGDDTCRLSMIIYYPE